MERRVLISGAFGDANARFGFYEGIAEALEARGWQVHRFNAFESLRRPVRGFAKAGERLFTLPGRWLGIPKERIRAALSWTMTGRLDRSLVASVESFRPTVLIDAAEIRQLYVVTDDIATFKAPEELLAKCEYYFAHQAEREKIADRRHQRALTFSDYYATAGVLMKMDWSDYE